MSSTSQLEAGCVVDVMGALLHTFQHNQTILSETSQPEAGCVFDVMGTLLHTS